MNYSIQIQVMKNKGSRYLLSLLLVIAATTSLTAQNINIPNKRGPMGLQVNTLTGNLFFSRTDLYIPGRGFPLDITFFYNSYHHTENNGFGKGWSFNYNIKYKDDSTGSKTISWGEGRKDRYTPAGSGSFTPPKGIFNGLSEYQPGKYLLVDPDGIKFYFDNAVHKKITKIEEPNGNFLTMTYADTLLTAITNTAGQIISLNYTNGRLTGITDAISSPTRTITYTYDGAGNLTQVKDPLNGTNKYSYLVNGPMKGITDKNNNKVDIVCYFDLSISELVGCNKRISFSYDTSALVSYITDHQTNGANQVTQYSFKKTENTIWLSSLSGNCCGFNMKFEYDAAGNKIKETDAKGNSTHFTYDGKGNLLTITDPLGQTITYTYSSNLNRVISSADEKGFITTMTYDAAGNLTQLIEPGNLVYTASYNSNGDITSSTDPKGNTFTYTYDTYGNPLSVTGPNGYQAALGYDARGNLLSFTDARGNTATLEYDILNRLKKIIDPANNDINLNYDAEGNAISVINENNETSTVGFDASNRKVRFTDAMNNNVTAAYDAMDNIISITNQLSNKMEFSYDTRNRITGLKDPLGNNTVVNYDANGNITSLSLPTGEIINYSYDVLNRITTITDAAGSLYNLVYDANNNITRLIKGTGITYDAEYDSLNRLKKITDPLGNSASLAYDKNSNLISVTDRNNISTTYTYDSLDRVKTITDNNGFLVSYGYDANGNITSAKDQNNNTTTYTYDNLNRPGRITYPDSRFIEYSYDSKGNITSKLQADGTLVNFAYDSLSRVISKTLPDGQVYSFAYDAMGRIVAATNNTGTVSITYDALNRIQTETFDGRTVQYSYNITGRTQTTIYPDSTVVTKTYDTRNRLTGISKNNSLLVSYQYNNNNQLTGQTFANGVSSNRQYDIAGRLINLNTASSSIQNTGFSYDNQGNKTAINRFNAPAKSEQFTYDDGYRITNYKRGPVGGSPVLQNSYTYDALGNRVSANLNGIATTYTSNNLNQLINSNGSQSINYTYNNNGNLIFDGNFYKFYDPEGRLVKDSSAPANVLTYQYDALGRRVRKNLNGNILKYSFSGMQLIDERDGGTGMIKNKTIFSNFLTPVVNEKDNNLFYYHQNELNSVEAITNQQGRLLEKYEYDVYGKMSIYDSLNNPLTGSLTGNQFGFTGQVYDSATGNYKFFFREYNPVTGLFNQRDLIGYTDGMGMYQYVHNNPANGVDVFGLEDCPDNTVQSDFTSSVKSVETVVSWENIFFSSYEVLHNEINQRLQNKALDQLYKMRGDWAEYYLRSLSNTKSGRQNAIKAKQVLEQMKNVKVPDGAKIAKAAKALDGVGKGLNVLDLVIKGHSFGEAINNYNNGSIDGAELSLSGGNLAQSALNFTGIGSAYSFADFLQQQATGKSMNEWSAEYGQTFGENSVDQKMDEELMEFHRKNGTIKKFLKAYHKTNRKELRKRVSDCPQNNGGGTQDPNGNGNPIGGTSEAISSLDPNEIIGPDGMPDKSWVSIKDRLPYTILFENDKTASAPAKYVKIVSPAHEKMDAATFQLGSFGFNSLTFAVPPATASYYQRLDCRDSLGLYVDITAGYDVQNNQAFWEFQSIDPVTLLPPADPLKGFLLRQDSLNNTSGHGFVNFSIKPVTTAQTLDSILARADIMFDTNDTIPTNIEKNTIDAFPPVSSISNLPDSTINTEITITYTGADDLNGSGVKWYSIYVSDNGSAPELYIANFRGTDTTFIGVEDHLYRFYITATDSTGNIEVLKLADSIFVKNGEYIICPNGTVTFDSRLSGTSYQWQVDTGAGFTNITDGGAYNGTNTSLLNISNAPSSMYGYQYRCLVNGTTYSTVFLLKFGMTWEGTVSTAWENPANWSCNSLPDENTDVIVGEGKLNYPQVNSNVSIRTLRFRPGASGTVNSGFTLTILK